MPTATLSRAPTSDYRLLTEQVRQAGLLNRRRRYYGVKIALTVGGYLAGWAAVVMIGNSWATLGVAVFLGLMSTQVVFLGHDAGHLQIFRSHRANRWVGFGVGNLLTGLSFAWWVPKHNTHHAHPNEAGKDPDIGAGVIAFTDEVAAERGRVGRWLARWQAWLFFPLLLLEGVSLKVTSIQGLRVRRDRSAVVEALLLAGHAAAYLFIVFWVLSPGRALVFVAVQQALFGLYLGCSFAPNHKGMPIIDNGAELGFVRRQVITARNLRGDPVTTMVFGGLNYQIEHHLFPSMPRPNLARAQAIVRAFCAEHDLAYTEDSLIGSYRRSLRHLRAIGAGVA